MASNLERYNDDLQKLIKRGRELLVAVYLEVQPESKAKESKKNLPDPRQEYQSWYSEAVAVIEQLIPHRLADFVGHYERPKNRKELSSDSYRIQDYLLGLTVTHKATGAEVVGFRAAVPHLQQQVAILESVEARFQSSLFDIRQLVQADVFDSELDAAEELARNKFLRAAGALAGVVLERHLGQVCDKHRINVNKKNPTISDYNDALKNAGVIDTPQWRSIQFLADIRNLCDHDKKTEPSAAQVGDLIEGVNKAIKTLF